MHTNAHRSLSIAVILGCLLLSLSMVAASAQSNGHQPKPNTMPSVEDYFKMLDKNGDGKLSAGEWHAESLKAADANGDGVVTLEEFKVFVAERVNKPSNPSHPANPSPSPEEYFKKLDKNGDGKLTAGEWNEQGLKGADANGDGVVTPEEFKAFLAQHYNKPTNPTNPSPSPEEYFKKLDKNGDGKLTAGEWNEQGLKGADANGDGVVTPEEFRAFVAQHYNKPGNPSNPSPSPEEYFKKLDKNGDGKLTAGEWNEQGLKGADANGDGAVTLEEFRAFVAQHYNKPTNPANSSPTPEEYFKKLDKNGDGKLTAGEWNEQGLKSADANGDGVVTLEEFRAFVAQYRH